MNYHIETSAWQTTKTETGEQGTVINQSYYYHSWKEKLIKFSLLKNSIEFLPFVSSPIMAISKNEKYLVASGSDNSIRLYNLAELKEVAKLFIFDNKNYFAITPDNYYISSKNGISKIAIRNKGTVYSMDQFDLLYNRPDIVLERIGTASPEQIEMYKKSYFKRLRRLNFSENMLTGEFHLPEVTILKKEDIPLNTQNPDLLLECLITDSKYRLDKLNIYVNDVPVYGMSGHDLRSIKTDTLLHTTIITLSSGKNNIKVDCINEKGVQSIKDNFTIYYEPPLIEKPHIYFIGIGVKNYFDSSMNLTYSAKDIRDMTTAFSKRYPDCIIDTLIDNMVTKENILNLKAKLQKTNVDDKVILSISGHGLLSKNLDFYYATYDVNFKNPVERGLLYEDLESLLDNIPARNKLLLLDACHSGEVDKDSSTNGKTLVGDSLSANVKALKPKGALFIKKGALGLQNSFELMQELFSDLSNGSGATVISAAGGMEYAFEGSNWNNGVFTYSVLRCLEENGTSSDGVAVSKIKDCVTEKVMKLTNGRQKPTSRREYSGNDFIIW